MPSSYDYVINAIELFPDPILIVDKSGLILSCNNQLSKFFGYSREELLKQPISVLIPSRYHEHHHKHVASFGHANTSRKMGEGLKLFALKKDGAEVDVDIALAPLETNDGEAYTMAVIRDISDKRQFEVSLLEKNEKLAKLNNELKKFAHIVSHDLKSPLGRIKALASLLKQGASCNDSKEYHDISILLQENIEGMERLIQGILRNAELDEESPKQHHFVDLNQMVDELKKLIYIPDHFHIQVKDTLPTIKGNRTQLIQLFMNLISNAVKYNDKDRGLLEIGYEDEADAYSFYFADNGQVVAPEKRDVIFKLFGRESTLKSEQSQGIGLNTVREIVMDAQGELWYTESPLGGSCFRFTWKK
ncbi:MAG: ATP-binding protein [Bacteroidota bacterium]